MPICPEEQYPQIDGATHPDGDHYNRVKQLIIDKNVKVGELFHGGVAGDYGVDVAHWIKPEVTETSEP